MTLAPYLDLIRFYRPVGWLVLLWPTLIAVWVANNGNPSVHMVLVFALGVFLTRSAGCAINDYADRHWDGGVERTRQRPLVTGALSPRQALACFGLLMVLAFGLVLTLTPMVWLASIVAVALAALYPFTKRFTNYPQLFLGAAFSWGIVMAFVAAGQPIGANALTWFAANLLWTLAYDTLYAMVDKPDDVKVGIKSTAIAFGDNDQRMVGVLQAAAWVLWALAGWQAGLGFAFILGMGIAANLFVNQHKSIVKADRSTIFAAFVANHRVGLVIFVGVLLDYAFQAQ
ncbi:4-hydroxybenzoate octaprenyltransferase [Litorivicinus lipolyticus]|uniref:4-hydroxybenzoate octaprenyltransferase n=1 Tax=Litorivicinus lipolyticus TaxID=418701 RepID=A0A5Q2QB51_9GAMM|nr:4-hydroxybenzoate octaprenyltransferase [Litorivicinus lipolyticus]QGG79197.1 4-hydroxybenzoate octaprenyltransferase [Litorivicinus lipolyticus]